MTNDYIAHYGIKRRSGRYPWGSGDRPYQGDGSKYIERYSKSIKKVDRLQAKSDRLRKKAERLKYKGDKRHYKAVKKQLKARSDIDKGLALEQDKKASKLILKSDKLNRKADRIDTKNINIRSAAYKQLQWAYENGLLEKYSNEKSLLDLKYYKQVNPEGYKLYAEKYGSNGSKSVEENIVDSLNARGASIIAAANEASAGKSTRKAMKAGAEVMQSSVMEEMYPQMMSLMKEAYTQ